MISNALFIFQANMIGNRNRNDREIFAIERLKIAEISDMTGEHLLFRLLVGSPMKDYY